MAYRSRRISVRSITPAQRNQIARKVAREFAAKRAKEQTTQSHEQVKEQGNGTSEKP